MLNNKVANYGYQLAKRYGNGQPVRPDVQAATRQPYFFAAEAMAARKPKQPRKSWIKHYRERGMSRSAASEQLQIDRFNKLKTRRMAKLDKAKAKYDGLKKDFDTLFGSAK
jgi:hypothetical protein